MGVALSAPAAIFSAIAQEHRREEASKADREAAKEAEGEEEGAQESEEETDAASPSQDEGEGEGEDGKPKSPWKISGIINRAFLGWNDGRRGARSVDNSQDSTAVTVEGEFELPNNWTAGVVVSLDAYFASSDSVDQLSVIGDGFVTELADAYVEFGHEKHGRIVVGHSDSASDGIDNINLAASDVIADASVDNWIGNFFLRGSGFAGNRGLTTGRPKAFNRGEDEVRWGDFIDGPYAGDSGRFLSYYTPEVNGFEGSVSIGQPQEIFLANTGLPQDESLFTDKTNGVLLDAALRYTGNWNEVFRIGAGVGAWIDTTEEQDADEPTEDAGVGGSIAALHIPTGLNLSLNYALEGHTNACEDRGAVSRKCRGNDQFIYLKGGIIRNLVGWGPTVFYGEHYRGWKDQNDSSEGVLRTLELKPNVARELAGSVASVWGFGVVQQIKSVPAEVYVGYRNYDLDVDLIGRRGPVASRRFENVSVVMAGLTIALGDTGD